jgi:hypothetical protein
LSHNPHYPFRNPRENLLGIEAEIERPQPVDTPVHRLTRKDLRSSGPIRPIRPASPAVLVGRLAVSRVEAADGWHELAAHRLAGAFDDDMDTRIALATIAVLQEQGLLGDLE